MTNNLFKPMSDLEPKYPAAPTEPPRTAEMRDHLDKPLMRLQFGPSHPATHGTVKIVLDLEGEQVVNADVQVGFLHRGFEKECETGYYYQNIPYTDRLNYSSPILNNVAYCMAVEKLFGIETPPRCNYLRVISGELSRMADHMLCVGSSAMELAAYTPFLLLLEARELVLDEIASLCGARVTTNFIRIGGVSADMPDGFKEFSVSRLDNAIKLQDDAHKLLTKNPVFRQRMEGTGHLSPQDLVAWGVTGPMLRAGGVPYDLRRVQPYLVYGDLDFDVPVGEHSDNFDRFLVRMEELIDQFKLVTEGGIAPAGEVYHAVEAANGELGFYIVSDGTGKPWKCRCRSPSFSNISPLAKMIIGGQLADVVPTFGMINMIGGECDR